ncbi:four helix bundle protein, partial [Candidatus Falkowbacteria bacterium]|nr:four helix bundle protein [Candidatus Falkowbacteria bacterium]
MPSGGYKNLLSYKQATIVYDFTYNFCEPYINRFSRTKDQMTQAARSGKQNIVEGSQASRTSNKTEIRLLGVARASLQELLEDYEDFLR